MQQNDFQKHFFKLMNSAVFEKAIKNVRKYRDIKLVTTEERRNYWASEPNYHKTKFFLKIFKNSEKLALEMKKTQIFMNKPVYLGLSILEISKIVMHEFYYDHMKTKDGEKLKLW